MARGEPMDIWKIAVMATPVKFDDGESGTAPCASSSASSTTPCS
jgi:hypothetical protein